MSSTNHIKIGSSTKLSLNKGNITVGVKGTTEYGPTSESGFYNGITPPVGGYTIYVEKVSQGPSIHVPANNTECMYYLKKYGAPDGTIDDMLTWALTQNTILVLKGELTNSIQTASFQNVAGSNDATGFFFGGFRNDGLLDFVKVGFLANGTGVTNAPVTAIDRNNQTITISGSQFVSGQFYTFSLDINATPAPTSTPTPQPTSTPTPTPTSTPATYTIGQSALGGIIAYINGGGSTGTSGLVVTSSDVGSAVWGCADISITTSESIGTGNANTLAIVAGCTTSGIAAKVCNDLVEGGYSDWYLPSYNELVQLYNNYSTFGMSTVRYWSSSQVDTGNAKALNFALGFASNRYKDAVALSFRAVRSF